MCTICYNMSILKLMVEYVHYAFEYVLYDCCYELNGQVSVWVSPCSGKVIHFTGDLLAPPCSGESNMIIL